MSDQDRNAIIQVINLYGLAIDARRWDLFDRVFTQDVDAQYSDGRHWTDLATFKTDFEVGHEPYYHTQHAMLNHLVTVSGDTAEAFTYVEWRLVMRRHDGDDWMEGAAWYDDDVVRTSSGWLIKRRNCRTTWWHRTHVPAAEVKEKEAFLQTLQVREFSRAGVVPYLNAI